jgi:hypothetical protein
MLNIFKTLTFLYSRYSDCQKCTELKKDFDAAGDVIMALITHEMETLGCSDMTCYRQSYQEIFVERKLSLGPIFSTKMLRRFRRHIKGAFSARAFQFC